MIQIETRWMDGVKNEKEKRRMGSNPELLKLDKILM